MSKTRTTKGFLVLLYILAFMLLREWLLPVMELSDTDHLLLFLMFIILAFILSLARFSWWISGPVKIFYIFEVLHFIYMDKVLFSKETATELLRDIFSNFSFIAIGDWGSITNPFRTILFFILLWMTTYLIRYWIEVRKNIFLFYAMSVLYIAFIDTFTEYSADGVIIRIMVSGLLLLGLLYITKLSERHDKAVSSRTFAAIAVPLLFFVIASGAVANILPKQDPIWPDPVPFIQSAIEGKGVGDSGMGVAKSGYGPDDSVLGGPFVKDNTLVFEAEVERKQYWKIETKNTYTSKGWEQHSINESLEVYFPGMEMGETADNKETSDERMKFAQLTMSEKFPFLIYPYGMTKAIADSDVSFLHSTSTGQYLTKIGESESSLSAYGLHFIEKNYSLKELRNTTMKSFASSEIELAQYLQLPEELPHRVRDLAVSITGDIGNVYDKTKAIERYFGRDGFVYDQKNVAVPGATDDYVDQFLFETKRGYCDNFSSSMVIMLRTIGIPARWVKGFAPGEVSRDTEGTRVYQITNNEAHSWVEAYMPGIGWMPFEPTIGFGGPASIDYDIEMELSDPEIPERIEKEKTEQKEPDKVEVKDNNQELINLFSTFGSWLINNIWMLVIYLGLLLVIGWRVFAARRKWLPKVLVTAYRTGKQDWYMYVKRYKSLLKQLDRYGITRKSGMTLSSYAVQVDTYFGGDTMRRLTLAYEKGLYGNETTEHDWLQLQKMWEDLINRTSG